MSVAWVAAGVAAVGVGATIYEGNKAAGAQSDAASASNAEARYEFDQNQQRMAPWLNTGKTALNALSWGLGLPGSNDPYGTGGQPLDYNTWLSQQPGGGAPAGGGIGNGNPTAAPWRPPMNVDGVPISRLGLSGDGGPGDIRGIRGANAPAGGNDAASRAAYAQYVANFKPTTPPPGSPGYGDLNRDFTIADFNKDPGYQFRMDQGQQALERSAAARGGLLSGAAIKGALEYGQGFGSNEYSNAYNRFNADRTARFNRLSAVAGTGQTAATGLNAAGTDFANTYGSNLSAGANARAAGAVNTGNAINSGLSSIGNFYLQQQYLNRYAPQQQAPPPASSPSYFAPNSGSYNI